MKTHKVIGIYSGDTYFVGTLNECEDFIDYEIADSFRLVALEELK